MQEGRQADRDVVPYSVNNAFDMRSPSQDMMDETLQHYDIKRYPHCCIKQTLMTDASIYFT